VKDGVKMMLVGTSLSDAASVAQGSLAAKAAAPILDILPGGREGVGWAGGFLCETDRGGSVRVQEERRGRAGSYRLVWMVNSMDA
jgi:hypothetical protein